MASVDATNQPLQPKKRHKRSKRRKSWPQLAQQYGISVRTLDRWSAAGIVASAEYINGRKYGDPDQAPRLDVKRRKAASQRDAETGLLLKSAT
jgi:hypothetical protein